MDSPDPEEPAVVTVTVVRTGGFAGIRRQWTAEPAEPERPRWIALIRQCPWDEAGDAGEAPEPDRFTWRIEAQLGGDDRRAELAETRLNGPWRDLVAQVQAFDPGR